MALDRLLRLVPEAGSAGHDSKGVLCSGEPCLGDLCGPLDCRLCDVTLNLLQQGHAHYQGRRHSRKLRGFLSRSSGSVSREPVRPSQVMLAPEADYGQLSSSSPEVAPTHYNGMDRSGIACLGETRKNINKSEIRNNGSGVTVLRGWNLRAAAAGDAHTRQMTTNPGNRVATGAYHTHRRRIPRDLTMCVTPSGRFYCSLCNCGAEQESDFRSHLSSKAHRTRASESLYRTENLGHS